MQNNKKFEGPPLGCVMLLFFVWGFATVLVDTLVPKLKALFTLSYAEVMLTQFSFFLAYFIMSLPAGALLARVGYVRAIICGLAIMACGCLLFIPATQLGIYPIFLLALFVMASGITMLQIAANPLVALLSEPQQSHSRLNLAQAFNSLGTAVGPWIGAIFILGNPTLQTGNRVAEAHALQCPFVAIAIGLIVLAGIFSFFRGNTINAERKTAPASAGWKLLKQPRLSFGALAMFVYVGAEVSIGSLLINYLMQEKTLMLAAVTAGKLISVYWGGAMIGRFIGSFVLKRVTAGTVLGACACAAAILVSISAISSGMLAATTILAVGLCNSIMFPTIFTLAIEHSGSDTPRASAIVCVAIVGGAIVPVVTGFAADKIGLSLALLVPALCYVIIAGYGAAARFDWLERKYAK
ncbi:MAG TPA: sugar MFS transporter [Spongiibacteraceae bacterium]|jgi:FHS family L-fucose permease-like MFS transporter